MAYPTTWDEVIAQGLEEDGESMCWTKNEVCHCRHLLTFRSEIRLKTCKTHLASFKMGGLRYLFRNNSEAVIVV